MTTTAVPRPVPVCPQARISGTRLFFPRPFFGPHKWDSPRGLDTSATSCSAGATGTQRGHGEWCLRPSEGCVVLPLVQGTPSRPCPHPPECGSLPQLLVATELEGGSGALSPGMGQPQRPRSVGL